MPPRHTLVLVTLLLIIGARCVAQPKPRPLAFRGTHFFIFDVEPGERVTATLRPVRMRYDFGILSYAVFDSRSRTLCEVDAVRQAAPISFVAPRDAGDVAILVVRGNRNWYMVESPEHPYIVRASREQPAHVTGDTGRFYFYVPKGTKRVRVYVTCDSPREGATVRVLRADGSEAARMTDQFDRTKPIDAANPKRSRGVWAIQLEHPRRNGANYSLDDVVLFFSKNVPPFIAVDPFALPGPILRHPE